MAEAADEFNEHIILLLSQSDCTLGIRVAEEIELATSSDGVLGSNIEILVAGEWLHVPRCVSKGAIGASTGVVELVSWSMRIAIALLLWVVRLSTVLLGFSLRLCCVGTDNKGGACDGEFT